MSRSNNSTFAVVSQAFCLGIATGFLVAQVLRAQKDPEPTHGSISSSDDDEKNLDESQPAPRRFGAAIKLRRTEYLRYRQLHDAVWPQVLERMYLSNIRNFTIYYHAETDTLYQSFEWVGHWKKKHFKSNNLKDANSNQVEDEQDEETLFQKDMNAIANDPITRAWWKECEPCQQPFSQWKQGAPSPSEGGPGDQGGSWWAPLECVAHCGHWPLAYSKQSVDPDFATLS